MVSGFQDWIDMKDFTLSTYKTLLLSLLGHGYKFKTYKDFQYNKANKTLVLRHDVDLRKENSLAFARIQNILGIVGTYYFRVIPQSFNEQVIKEIASWGHEIGYHYETMDSCRGNVDKAYDEFCHHLEMFRRIVTVETICMHGSPLSKFDNRALWDKYDYRTLGLIAEPYFDLDFNKTFYITDTGRQWDGSNFSIRDKASKANPIINPEFINRWYHSTSDIIYAIENDDFPNMVMMNFHPQRWTDDTMLWLEELIVQTIKNQVKRFLVK